VIYPGVEQKKTGPKYFPWRARGRERTAETSWMKKKNPGHENSRKTSRQKVQGRDRNRVRKATPGETTLKITEGRKSPNIGEDRRPIRERARTRKKEGATDPKKKRHLGL